MRQTLSSLKQNLVQRGILLKKGLQCLNALVIGIISAVYGKLFQGGIIES